MYFTPTGIQPTCILAVDNCTLSVYSFACSSLTHAFVATVQIYWQFAFLHPNENFFVLLIYCNN